MPLLGSFCQTHTQRNTSSVILFLNQVSHILITRFPVTSSSWQGLWEWSQRVLGRHGRLQFSKWVQYAWGVPSWWLVPSSPSGGELLQFYQRTTHAVAEVILYLILYTLDVRYYISHQRYGSLSQVGPTDRSDTHSYDPIGLGVKS